MLESGPDIRHLPSELALCNDHRLGVGHHLALVAFLALSSIALWSSSSARGIRTWARSSGPVLLTGRYALSQRDRTCGPTLVLISQQQRQRQQQQQQQ